MNINIIILIRVHSCSSVVSLIPYPLSSFLFPVSDLKALVINIVEVLKLELIEP